MSGLQDITVVFSRPVIALGSDFDSSIATSKVPFRLSCNFPGKTRWVTTSIARFDPDEAWPTDLGCDLIWNTALRTYDGVKLQLGGVRARQPLTGPSLYVSSYSVVSELAENITGGEWTSWSLTPGDKAPEVPPDGRVQIYFSYKVNLKMLQSALQLLEGNPNEGNVTLPSPRLPFTVRPCTSPVLWLPTAVQAQDSLDVNSTCADVEVGAGLKPDSWYTLRLPAGSRYNAPSLTGPLPRHLDVSFAGLRPFRVPFASPIPAPGGRSYSYYSYRRWDVLLPHSLSPTTTAAALAASVRVCEPSAATKTAAAGATCASLAFTLTLPGASRMAARLTVPGAQPGRTYRVYVSANPAVRDGFGQPLLASSTEFAMSPVSYDFRGPGTVNPGLVVLEAGFDTLSSWPYVTRAPEADAYGWPAGGYPRNITSYAVDPLRDSAVAGLFTYIPRINNYYSDSPADYLGRPTSTLAVPRNLTTPGSGAGWSEVRFPLSSASLQVVHACCTPVSNWYAYPSSQVVLRTNLSLVVVQSGPILVAWVTDAAAGGGSGPVAGAEVAFYALVYNGYDSSSGSALSYKLTSCTTNSNGFCTTTLAPEQQDGIQLAALARSVSPSSGAVRSVLLPRSGWASSTSALQSYVATLALDRRLVEPGDSVKVTGFVQHTSPTTLGALAPAPEAWVVLTVSPDFTAASRFGGSKPVAVAKLNGTTGTFHAEISVPASARMAGYDLAAYLAPSAPTSSPFDLSAAADFTSSPDDLVPLAYGNIVVSSPRPPTAELLLSSDPWVTPTAAATVNVTAVSYIGASVGGSPVTVTWYTGDGKLSGKLDLVTDVNGFASGKIDLVATAAARTAADVNDVVDPLEFAGRTISVHVEWIGPTRERITRASTINIALGPASVSISTSLQTDTPGVPFTIAVNLLSSADGAALAGLPVTATLRPAPPSSSSPSSSTPTPAACALAVPPSCATTSGAGWAAAATASATPCRFALPCVGKYVIEACADVPSDGSGSGGGSPTRGSVRVCGNISLGEEASFWAASPLSEHPQPVLELDKPGGYRLGEQPKLWLDNPFSGARLLVVWGTGYGVRTQVFNQLPAGAGFTATIGPLGPECAAGCALTAVLDVPRLTPTGQPAAALPPAAQLPVATLFDPRAPHTRTLSAHINVLRDNELAVAVEVAAPVVANGSGGATTVRDASGASLVVVEPGASAQITVEVASEPSDGPVEVTVYGVDKAFLDLLSYDLPAPQQEMLIQINAYLETFSLDPYRIAPGSVRAVYDKLLARLTGLDPWLPLATSLQPSGGVDPVDSPDEAYLAGFTAWLTSRTNSWWSDWYSKGEGQLTPVAPAFAAKSPPPPSAGTGETSDISSTSSGETGSGSGSSSSSGFDSPRRSGEFVVTPLFAHSLTGADGRATFNFTAPQNLGAFVIRAFAAAGSVAKYGSSEGKLVVRRSLSLTPSVPPFVRVGDTFEAGVVVTLGSVAATTPTSVVVALRLNSPTDSPVRLTGPASKTVTFTAAGGLQQEVRFSFRAVAVGASSLVISASDATPGGGSDSLEMEIPVEGQQGDVWVATSFALAANASDASSPGGWVEGIQLPSAVPGSGGLSLTAGVGYLPSLSAMYDNLAVEDAWRTEPYAQPAMLWAVLPAVLSYYGQIPSETQAAQAARGVADLAALSEGWLGLRWWLPSRWPGWWQDRVDVSLNTWALVLVSLHSAAPVDPTSPWAATVLTSLVPRWRDALEVQLLKDVVEARQQNYTWADWNTEAWVRLALGANWTLDASLLAEPEDVATLSLANMLAAYRSKATRWQFDRQTRMVLSLVLLSLGPSNPEPDLVNSTLAEVTSALRVQGRTAYVAAYPGSASAASLDDQALALLLLLRSGATHQLLHKLAAYVASPTSSSGGGLLYFSAPWSAQALAAAALTAYDRSRGSSRPSVDLAAEVNGLTVLQASFRVNRTRPVSNTTAWEDLPPPPRGQPSELDFAVAGTGEVTVAASLHFVPTALPAFPTYRGIFVDLAIQLVDPATGQPTGPRVASVPLGAVVSLTVQLTSPDDLGAVTLSVMMPGGLEPLDPNLVPDAGSSCFTDWLGAYSWRTFYPGWWWWPVCPVQETRPSVVTFSYAALRAGTSTASIKAVAATAGTFVVPPVRASVDEQPEVMGMTAAGSVVVCAGCTAPVAAAAPRAPKPCPGDCSDAGLCNLKTGVCVCDAGFGGADCATRVLLSG